MKRAIPEAGDIIWLDFDPQVGTEINKRRPALVLSPFDVNKTLGFALVVPITSKKPKHLFHLELPSNIEGFDYPTAKDEVANLKTEQVRSLDFRARKAVYIAKVSDSFLTSCRSYVDRLLGR